MLRLKFRDGGVIIKCMSIKNKKKRRRCSREDWGEKKRRWQLPEEQIQTVPTECDMTKKKQAADS